MVGNSRKMIVAVEANFLDLSKSPNENELDNKSNKTNK